MSQPATSTGTSAPRGDEATHASTQSMGDSATRGEAARVGLPQRAVLRLIRAYQLLFSPMYAGSCRYLPSCSAYAAEAIERFGVLYGGYLAVRRLLRCHPFGGSGLDPVPAPRGRH